MGKRSIILGYLDTDKLEKLNKQLDKDYIAIEANNAPIKNFMVPISEGFAINSGTVPQTPTASGCLLSVCGTSPGMCIPGFSVTGFYGFKGIPLDKAIQFYAKGHIPGNATAFKPEGELNGALLNSFVSGDGSITNPSVYSDLVTGGNYKFQNLDVEPDLNFPTCEAYDNYTSNKIADYQGYGVVGDKTIDPGDGTELDDSHCGSLSSFIGTYRSEASCLAGSYTVGGVAYSGSSYLTWSVF